MPDHGCADVRFLVWTDSNVELLTNILVVPQNYPPATVAINNLSVFITTEVDDYGTRYFVAGVKLDGVIMDQQNILLGVSYNILIDIRIVLYNSNVSVYFNDYNAYNYTFMDNPIYPEIIQLWLKSNSGQVDLLDIRRQELPDAREALFVDYEATTESAIQSIIQQRPVEITPETDGGLNFTYYATKDTVEAHHVYSYDNTVQDNMQMSSDAIVYYEDVGVVVNPDTMKEVGFITRMYRLSELSAGAMEAAKKMQNVALQKRHNIVVIMNRLDPRIEPRDILHIDLVISGTNTAIEDWLIVEDVYISMRNGAYQTRITGRQYNNG